jgi:hypothetical protein
MTFRKKQNKKNRKLQLPPALRKVGVKFGFVCGVMEVVITLLHLAYTG